MSSRNQNIIDPFEDKTHRMPFSKELTLLLSTSSYNETTDPLTFVFGNYEVAECKEVLVEGMLMMSITFIFQKYEKQVSFRVRHNGSEQKVILELYEPILIHPCKAVPNEDTLSNYTLFDRDLSITDADGKEVRVAQSEFIEFIRQFVNPKKDEKDSDGSVDSDAGHEVISQLFTSDNGQASLIYWLEGSTANGKTMFLMTLMRELNNEANVYRLNFHHIIRYWVGSEHDLSNVSAKILDFIRCIRPIIHNHYNHRPAEEECLNKFKDYLKKKKQGKDAERDKIDEEIDRKIDKEIDASIESMFKMTLNPQNAASIFVVDEIDILFSYFEESPVWINYFLSVLIDIFWNLESEKFVILFADNTAWDKRDVVDPKNPDSETISTEVGPSVQLQSVKNNHYQNLFSCDLESKFYAVQQVKLLPITDERLKNHWEKLITLSKEDREYWQAKSVDLYEETHGNTLLLMSIIAEIIEKKTDGKRPRWHNVIQQEASNYIEEAIRYLCQKSCPGTFRKRIIWSENVYILLEQLKESPEGLNPTEIKNSSNESIIDSLLSLGIIYWTGGTYKLVPIVKKHLEVFIKECKAEQSKEAGNDSN